MPGKGHHLCRQRQVGAPRTYTFDAANQIVTLAESMQLSSYSYDANGNVTYVFGTEEGEGFLVDRYTYDNEHRLLSKTGMLSWNNATFTYDGDGLRRSWNEGGALTTIIWDGDDYLM